MTSLRPLIFAVLLLAGLLPGRPWAHGDEDHSHADAQPVAPAPSAQPLRVEAASELFELVGMLQGDQLVIHLDHFASNEPVLGARIAVEGGPLKATAAVERDGRYSLPAASLAAPGRHALVFTVQAGALSDLLTGDLVVPAPPAAAATPAAGWAVWAGGRVGQAGLALAALVLLGAGLRALRRRAAAPAEATA